MYIAGCPFTVNNKLNNVKYFLIEAKGYITSIYRYNVYNICKLV